MHEGVLIFECNWWRRSHTKSSDRREEDNMPRSSFVSFHYQKDHWRVQQILRMGALDGQEILPAQEWEEVKRRGNAAVEAWINEKMNYKQAVIVMIGSETASRPFVQYEIRRAWQMKKPMLGIMIHGLQDSDKQVGAPGVNPFKQFGFRDSEKTFADYVPVFDPARYTGMAYPASTDIHAAIRSNLTTWASQGYARP